MMKVCYCSYGARITSVYNQNRYNASDPKTFKCYERRGPSFLDKPSLQCVLQEGKFPITPHVLFVFFM